MREVEFPSSADSSMNWPFARKEVRAANASKARRRDIVVERRDLTERREIAMGVLGEGCSGYETRGRRYKYVDS
jgi:hypothetical protein